MAERQRRRQPGQQPAGTIAVGTAVERGSSTTLETVTDNLVATVTRSVEPALAELEAQAAIGVPTVRFALKRPLHKMGEVIGQVAPAVEVTSHADTPNYEILVRYPPGFRPVYVDPLSKEGTDTPPIVIHAEEVHVDTNPSATADPAGYNVRHTLMLGPEATPPALTSLFEIDIFPLEPDSIRRVAEEVAKTDPSLAVLLPDISHTHAYPG